MFNPSKRNPLALKLAVTMAWGAGLAILSLQGCQSSSTGSSAAGDSAQPGKVLGIFPPPPDRSGAELWASNCNRCHNAPPPDRFSSTQWAVITHHMRLRADLTGEETRKITQFLQGGS